MTYFFIFSKLIPGGRIDFAPSTLCIGISSLLNILSITFNSSLLMGKWSLSYRPYIGVACTIHCTFQKNLRHLRWMLKYFLYLTSILDIIVEVWDEIETNNIATISRGCHPTHLRQPRKFIMNVEVFSFSALCEHFCLVFLQWIIFRKRFVT